MINKKLIAFDRGAMRFVGANVAFQWLGMLCNIIFVRAVAQLVGAVFAGGLTHEMLRQDSVLCLFTTGNGAENTKAFHTVFGGGVCLVGTK